MPWVAITTYISPTNTHAQIATHLGAITGVHEITGNVVGTTDVQTLTSKTFNDTSTTFQNSSVNAKKIQFSATNVTSGPRSLYTGQNLILVVILASLLYNT